MKKIFPRKNHGPDALIRQAPVQTRNWLLLCCLLLQMLPLHLLAGANPPDDLPPTPEAFITTWKTDNPGTSNSSSITIPTVGSGYNYEVDWNNDGIFDQTSITGNVTHDFGAPGTYTIRIRGSFPRIYFDDSGDKQKLLDISQWGAIAWTSMAGAFTGCSNLNISATDMPDLGSVTSMAAMFYNCSSLNGPTNIGTWNTGAVTNMRQMFTLATNFNQPIGGWNTAAVTDMRSMFSGAPTFNQPIGGWNTANVTYMSDMFSNAQVFNQPIGNWNTAKVTDMSTMFSGAYAFNQPIGDWNTANVTDMSSMFSITYAFNQPIGNWNTAKVTDMSTMFFGADAFNQPIGNWNTANVADMNAMFSGAVAFNQPIGGWNTAAVTDMSSMFSGAEAFNQPIDGWNTASVTDMSSMFSGADAFSQPIGNWNTANVTDMNAMFYGAYAFNQPIGGWNTAKVTDMSSMFFGAVAFNQPIGGWNTAKVTDMSQMFVNAYAFNQPIGNWNTAKVTDMSGMFAATNAFNQPIGNWNTANVTDMSTMFSGADAFNQPIGDWNTANVTDMSYMFFGADAFNQPIGDWNTINVTDMSWMFAYADVFNQPIGNWNTANVTDMSYMFDSAEAFNQPIGNWNTANVTDMSYMFYDADAFNQPIGNWNTANATDMSLMFFRADAFNQPIGDWNTANVTNMRSMFVGAYAFNQPIGDWALNGSVNMESMLNNCGMDCANYSATLQGWSDNPATPAARVLGATGRRYQPAAVAARTHLTDSKGWIIFGDDPISLTFYLDTDGDGYGSGAGISACSAPTGYADNNADCNDNDDDIHPDAVEVCDGIDNDCDGLTDSADPNLLDNTPPSITCANATISFNGEQSIALNPAALASASDNCGMPGITLSPNAVTAQQLGQTVPVTVTATDNKGNLATCIAQVSVGGLPAGWSQNPNGVGCPGGNSIAYNPATGVWTAMSTGCFYGPPYTSDATSFAQRTLCGNGSITAQVTGISGTALGWAGIVMRESNAPGAKKAQLMTNLSNLSRREFRTATNDQSIPQQFPSQNRYWLRITRAGNQFNMFVSSNGISWFPAGTQNIVMDNCIQMGLVATNYTANSTVTATFAGVSYSGSNGVLALPDGGVQPLAPHFSSLSPDFEVYPNPTGGELNVDLTQYIGRNVRIELYSIEGKLLQIKEMEDVRAIIEIWNLSEYAAGMYFLKVKSGRLPDVTKRVVLQR